MSLVRVRDGRPGDAVPSNAPTRRPSDQLSASGETPHDPQGSSEPLTTKTIGRYVLLERIGAGGMGLVFAAFDPELDRKIALKVLRGSGRSAESRARLQREAQALARLDHPNVVRVFDVGTLRGRVYIAMELVEGSTLKGWLAQRQRPWREIMTVLVEAGRGLEAAHAVGVVHRDFKPENVLVGTDGRTRVTDFGLARAVGSDVPVSASPGEGEDVPELGMESTALTKAGTVVGTPAYMSPEQHRGELAGVHSDQYAFALSCFEALFGQRPFLARSHRELAWLKAGGNLPSTTGSKVPPRVRQAIERGLSPLPTQRWPSMAELLTELERASAPPARPWIAAALVCAAAGLTATWGLWPHPEQACAGASERIAAVWSPERRTEARAAFERSGVGYAEDAWARVARLVDAYADTWTEHYVHACEAGRHDERGAELLDRRMACLGERLAELDGLAGLLAEADAGVVEHAIEVALRLTPVGSCSDPPRVHAEGAEPRDPELVQQIERLRRRSARVDVLLDTGKHEWAVEEARAILDAATRLGDLPTLAAAQRTLGSAEERSGLYEEATTHLEQAYWTAAAAGAIRTAAHAAIDLAWLHGTRSVELERALGWARHAGAALARLGETGYDAARVELAIASSLTSANEMERARPAFSRALAAFERSVGPEHPEIATTLNNFAALLLQEGRYDEARAKAERALEIYLRTHGPEHPQVANATMNLSGVEQRTGNYERAIELGKRALEIRIATRGENHPEIATDRNNLGAAYAAMNDYTNAEQQYRAAAQMVARLQGEDHPNAAAARINLGLVTDRQGRHAEALEIVQPAYETLVAQLPASHPYILYGQLALGRVHLHLRHHDRARHWLGTAHARCRTSTGVDPSLCTLVSFEWARVRWYDPQTRDLASREAEQALEHLEATGLMDEVATARAWLRAHVRRAAD